MKFFILLCFVFLLSNASAQLLTQEKFYRAASGVVLVQAGIHFNQGNLRADFEDSLIDDQEIDFSQTDYLLQTQYGINEKLALGFIIKQSSNGADIGLSNYELFVKGQASSLVYKVSYFISSEDSKDDNFFTGGNYFEGEVGYQFSKHWGALVAYRPEYNVDYEVGDGKVGTRLSMAGLYEFHFGDHIMGIEANYIHESGTPDNNDFDYSYMGPGVYGNLKTFGFEFIPTFRVLSSFQDRETNAGQEYEELLTISTLTLALRKRF